MDDGKGMMGIFFLSSNTFVMLSIVEGSLATDTRINTDNIIATEKQNAERNYHLIKVVILRVNLLIKININNRRI
jgi:hypothetical protein